MVSGLGGIRRVFSLPPGFSGWGLTSSHERNGATAFRGSLRVVSQAWLSSEVHIG